MQPGQARAGHHDTSAIGHVPTRYAQVGRVMVPLIGSGRHLMISRTGLGSCPRDHLERPLVTGDPMINAPDRQNNRKIVAMDDTLADPLTGRLLDGRYAV